MARGTDRPRGALTDTDLEVLAGEKEYKQRNAELNQLRGTRQRIANAILDFNEIKQYTTDTDRKIVFSDISDAANLPDGKRASLIEALQSLIYWIYLGTKEQGYSFEQILDRPIRRAEEDYSRKYTRSVTDAEVRFEVIRSEKEDVKRIVDDIENGDPVRTSSINELLTLPHGVPIDPEKVDVVRVVPSSTNPEGELSVIKAVFSEYLGVDVEVENAIPVDRSHRKLDENTSRRSAIVDKDQDLPSPRKIPYRSQPTRELDPETIQMIRRKEGTTDADSPDRDLNTDKLGEVLDSIHEGTARETTRISELIDKRGESDQSPESIEPEQVHQLLRRVEEEVVTTSDVAAALDCSRDVVDGAMMALVGEEKVSGRTALSPDGGTTDLWWLVA